MCDGNNIAAAGTPVIDTMGVRGGAIHSAEEYMIVDSLAERAARIAMLAEDDASAAKALALLRGRDFATPQDAFDIAPEVLRHGAGDPSRFE